MYPHLPFELQLIIAEHLNKTECGRRTLINMITGAPPWSEAARTVFWESLSVDRMEGVVQYAGNDHILRDFFDECHGWQYVTTIDFSGSYPDDYFPLVLSHRFPRLRRVCLPSDLRRALSTEFCEFISHHSSTISQVDLPRFWPLQHVRILRETISDIHRTLASAGLRNIRAIEYHDVVVLSRLTDILDTFPRLESLSLSTVIVDTIDDIDIVELADPDNGEHTVPQFPLKVLVVQSFHVLNAHLNLSRFGPTYFQRIPMQIPNAPGLGARFPRLSCLVHRLPNAESAAQNFINSRYFNALVISSHLPGMRHLHITNPSVDNVQLAAVNFPDLKSLVFEYLNEFYNVDEACHAIAMCLRQFQHLESLVVKARVGPQTPLLPDIESFLTPREARAGADHGADGAALLLDALPQLPRLVCRNLRRLTIWPLAINPSIAAYLLTQMQGLTNLSMSVTTMAGFERGTTAELLPGVPPGHTPYGLVSLDIHILHEDYMQEYDSLAGFISMFPSLKHCNVINCTPCLITKLGRDFLRIKFKAVMTRGRAGGYR